MEAFATERAGDRAKNISSAQGQAGFTRRSRRGSHHTSDIAGLEDESDTKIADGLAPIPSDGSQSSAKRIYFLSVNSSEPFWRGVFPAITTQLKRDQSLDLEATARHADVLINSGVKGLIFLGSLGENQVMRREEKRTVTEAMVKAVNGRVPVLSGVAESSREEACAYVRDVEKLGVDGVMVMPAMLYKGDESETLAHFRSVAGVSGLPMMIYNNPVSYANDITPQMFARLADQKNFVALKESSGDVRRITDLRNTVGDRYAIFTGVDDLALEASILGIDGWVAGSGIAFPCENQYFWQLTRDGEWEKAREFYRWFTPLLHLDTSTKFVQYIKLAVQECGLGQEWVRAPRLPLAGDERERILKIIHHGIATRPRTSNKSEHQYEPNPRH